MEKNGVNTFAYKFHAPNVTTITGQDYDFNTRLKFIFLLLLFMTTLW